MHICNIQVVKFDLKLDLIMTNYKFYHCHLCIKKCFIKSVIKLDPDPDSTLFTPNWQACLHCELIQRSMCVVEHITNAADAVHAICIVRALVSMRAREWDYLYSYIKKSLTISAYLVMIKV